MLWRVGCSVGWGSILLWERSAAVYVVRGLSCFRLTTSLRCQCGVWVGISVRDSHRGLVVRARGSLVLLRYIFRCGYSCRLYPRPNDFFYPLREWFTSESGG